MAAPLLPRVKLDNRSSNTLLSVGVIVALFAAYYVLIGKEPVPPDTHVSYEMRVGGQTNLRVDMLGSGITHAIGSNGPPADYAVPDFAVRRVLAAFRKQHFLDLDVAAFPPVASPRVCQLGLAANHRRTVIRYDCAAPPKQVKSALQVFETATHFCKTTDQKGADCPV
jgi:hypothetical protein